MSGKAIRVYWWQGGTRHGNFGDRLAPLLCAHLSKRRVEHAEAHQAQIISVGSVLEPWLWDPGSWNDYQGFIWGAGRMVGADPMDLSAAQVLAVRGVRTLSEVQCRNKESVFLGDPGLLVSEFVRRRQTRYKLGIVPHWSEWDDPRWRDLASLSTEIQLIDPCDRVRDVIENISQCEHILSSSLHGLVVADSLGIPSAWLRLNTGRSRRAGLREFKYRDYYSVYGLEDMSFLTFRDCTGLAEILDRIGPFNRSGIEQVKVKLMESFPFRSS